MITVLGVRVPPAFFIPRSPVKSVLCVPLALQFAAAAALNLSGNTLCVVANVAAVTEVNPLGPRSRFASHRIK